MNPDFWRGRRVLLTGHTGFKGAWASVMLADFGAKVTAFALAPETDPNLWQIVGKDVAIESLHADLRDSAAVEHDLQRGPTRDRPAHGCAGPGPGELPRSRRHFHQQHPRHCEPAAGAAQLIEFRTPSSS